jgi:cold shock CspA family protein
MSEERITGTVKWVSSGKGFGFIRTYDATYMFLPDSAIQAVSYRALLKGDLVTFVVIHD